ncbi:unnamed protein product [Symbiodinium natans]|uniref:Uncharacterized protein n=1 Tax=Symbiodinium natans TaxID=878477 RepID=A0A812S1H2_9DINO|nr:unnamed protein product [Symbiodinium natans]
MDHSDEVAFLREEVSRLRHHVAILQGDLSGAHLTAEGLLARVLALEQSSSGHTVRLSDMEADLELCSTRLAEVQASLCAVCPLLCAPTVGKSTLAVTVAYLILGGSGCDTPFYQRPASVELFWFWLCIWNFDFTGATLQYSA